MPTETDLSRSIRKALETAGYRVERIQSGVIKRRIHCASPGTPDLLVVDHPAMWLEIKMPGEDPTSVQILNHEDIRRRGGTVYVVNSISEAFDAVREHYGRTGGAAA